MTNNGQLAGLRLLQEGGGETSVSPRKRPRKGATILGGVPGFFNASALKKGGDSAAKKLRDLITRKVQLRCRKVQRALFCLWKTRILRLYIYLLILIILWPRNSLQDKDLRDLMTTKVQLMTTKVQTHDYQSPTHDYFTNPL